MQAGLTHQDYYYQKISQIDQIMATFASLAQNSITNSKDRVGKVCAKLFLRYHMIFQEKEKQSDKVVYSLTTIIKTLFQLAKHIEFLINHNLGYARSCWNNTKDKCISMFDCSSVFYIQESYYDS